MIVCAANFRLTFCAQEEERQTALTKVLAMKPSELEARAGMQRRVTEITRGLSKEASTAFFELLPRLEVRRHHAIFELRPSSISSLKF